jgi:diphosphomevalonate decarboxylase
LAFSCTSHPNIALVKYWGKSDESEIIPRHGSLSVTLDFGSTTTSASFSDSQEFILNGHQEPLTARLQTATDFFRARTNRSFSISSDNDFPTAAGFASSAAGAAAFVGALAALAGDTETPIEYWLERNVNLSVLARRVSGSGCRSVFGGFVEWVPGDSENSAARQLFAPSHWPEFSVLSIRLEAGKKAVSSTVGMKRTAETVPWFDWRAKEIVPKRIREAAAFIGSKDFNRLSEIIMRESNELHANCAAAFPPIRYLNDRSHNIIDAVHELNSQKNLPVAYSFDAGPNPFVFVMDPHVQTVKSHLMTVCGIEETAFRLAKPADGIKCHRL